MRRTKAEITADALRLLELMIEDSEKNAPKHGDNVTNGRTASYWVEKMGWLPSMNNAMFHKTISVIRNSDDFADFVIAFHAKGHGNTWFYGISRNPAEAREYLARKGLTLLSTAKNGHLMAAKAIEKHGPVPELVEARTLFGLAVRVLEDWVA